MLSLFFVMLAAYQTKSIDEYIEMGDYHAANTVLADIQSPSNYNDYQKLIVAYKMNDFKQTEKMLKRVDNSFQKLERRHEALIYLMSEDFKHWKDGDLSDISRDMNSSASRLGVNKPDKTTREIQEQIISKLDKLIEEKENKAKGGGGADQAKGQAEQGGGQIRPQDESQPGGETGKGEIDMQKLKNYQENWGKLPENERVRIIKTMTRDLPPRSRIIIEEYFKALNKKEEQR